MNIDVPHPNRRRLFRGAAGIAIAFAIAGTPGTAHATTTTPSVKIEVGFLPDIPGARTTVSLGFTVQAPAKTLPPPLTRIEILLPRGMGLGTTDLGESVCTARTLETFGAAACPPNAYMGLGHALVEAQIGGYILQEQVQIAILMAPASHEHTTILYLAEGFSPLFAETIFQGEMLSATGPYGARVVTTVPVASAVPEGPDMALIHMQTTIGPQGITYFKTAKGGRVSYRPHGMVIPTDCSRSGYRFAARLAFLEAGEAYVQGHVPCGARHERRRHPEQTPIVAAH